MGPQLVHETISLGPVEPSFLSPYNKGHMMKKQPLGSWHGRQLRVHIGQRSQEGAKKHRIGKKVKNMETKRN